MSTVHLGCLARKACRIDTRGDVDSESTTYVMCTSIGDARSDTGHVDRHAAYRQRSPNAVGPATRTPYLRRAGHIPRSLTAAPPRSAPAGPRPTHHHHPLRRPLHGREHRAV